MGLAPRTMAALKKEGIESHVDLAEFDKDEILAIFKAFLKPPPVIQKDKDQKDYDVSARSTKRIIVVADAARYHTYAGCSLTAENHMHWTTLKNFEVQWTALKEKKKQDDPDVPKLSKKGNIIKFLESFKLHLYSIV